MNPTPSLNENYLWIPEVNDNVVGGLDSMITYIQSKYAILAALQKSLTNMSNNIQSEFNNLEILNQGILMSILTLQHNSYTLYISTE